MIKYWKNIILVAIFVLILGIFGIGLSQLAKYKDEHANCIAVELGQEYLLKGTAKTAKETGAIDYRLDKKGLILTGIKQGIAKVSYDGTTYEVLTLKPIKDTTVKSVKRRYGAYYAIREHGKTSYVTVYNNNPYTVDIAFQAKGCNMTTTAV